jgi:hypothetical protein
MTPAQFRTAHPNTDTWTSTEHETYGHLLETQPPAVAVHRLDTGELQTYLDPADAVEDLALARELGGLGRERVRLR